MRDGLGSMGKKDEYKSDVYRRLQLVEKQFKNSIKEQRKQEARERRRRYFSRLKANRLTILRYAVFSGMAMLVIAVIVVLVL